VLTPERATASPRAEWPSSELDAIPHILGSLHAISSFGSWRLFSAYLNSLMGGKRNGAHGVDDFGQSCLK
jgi:hypothetical protein